MRRNALMKGSSGVLVCGGVIVGLAALSYTVHKGEQSVALERNIRLQRDLAALNMRSLPLSPSQWEAVQQIAPRYMSDPDRSGLHGKLPPPREDEYEIMKEKQLQRAALMIESAKITEKSFSPRSESLAPITSDSQLQSKTDKGSSKSTS